MCRRKAKRKNTTRNSLINKDEDIDKKNLSISWLLQKCYNKITKTLNMQKSVEKYTYIL